MTFESGITVSELQIMFQGGFVGQDCHVLGSSSDDGDESALVHISVFYPEDNNALQRSFEIIEIKTEKHKAPLF